MCVHFCMWIITQIVSTFLHHTVQDLFRWFVILNIFKWVFSPLTVYFSNSFWACFVFLFHAESRCTLFFLRVLHFKHFKKHLLEFANCVCWIFSLLLESSICIKIKLKMKNIFNNRHEESFVLLLFLGNRTLICSSSSP